MDSNPHRISGVEESDPDTVTTVLVGLIGTVLLVATVALLQGLYDQVERRELRKKVVLATPEELRALRVKHLEQLAATAWVDPAAGVVSIPVDRAMELIVRDPTLSAVAPKPAATP